MIPSVGEGVEEMDCSHTAGENGKCYDHFGKWVGNFLKS